MMIADYLIENFDSKISSYFSSFRWKNNYQKTISQIEHDEPWLTLIACYAVLGNQKEIKQHHLSAINEIFRLSGVKKKLQFTAITNVQVEKKLPEILSYRSFLRELLAEENFHFYPDRHASIQKKLTKKVASFEGNTNLDLLIEGIANERKVTCFIEAKFLSDISCQTSYHPVRDQIARTIDCGIDYLTKKEQANSLQDFYFFLLTPQIFRIADFAATKKSVLNQFGANKSRLYCYKMKEYRNYELLKEQLPHRKLKDSEWQQLAQNIGWLSFEDIYHSAKKYSTFQNHAEEQMISRFFEERNLK